MDLLKELKNRLCEIEERLGYTFEEKEYLIKAFVHRSFLNECSDESQEHNERLEFLGDSVLSLIVAEYLFELFPDWPEGDLSPMRARLVDAKSCACYLDKLNVEEFLLLGKGQKLSLERARASIFADLFEAILGAIYLDSHYERSREFFFTQFKENIESILSEPDQNYKALLQKHVQQLEQITPLYRIKSEEGPDHAKCFIIEVFIKEEKFGEGEGASKKQAQQKAAQNACEKLGLIDGKDKD